MQPPRVLSPTWMKFGTNVYHTKTNKKSLGAVPLNKRSGFCNCLFKYFWGIFCLYLERTARDTAGKFGKWGVVTCCNEPGQTPNQDHCSHGYLRPRVLPIDNLRLHFNKLLFNKSTSNFVRTTFRRQYLKVIWSLSLHGMVWPWHHGYQLCCKCCNHFQAWHFISVLR